MNKKRKSPLVYLRYLCIAMVVIAILCLAACTDGSKDPLRATEETSATTAAIQTMYGTLQFPEALLGNLRHVEATEGQIAMEVFYMVTEGSEKELYRIHYADERMGSCIGYLTTDNGQISISYSICEYNDESFANEEERKLHHSMMDAFSVVMNSIHADERFSETRTMVPEDAQEATMRHWKLVLPSNVQFVESEDNGNYRADFFGIVEGERINLYMIGLGNLEAESMLGTYEVNGEQLPLVVETFDLDEYSTWSEENQRVIYQMMSTINDVIQQITASKGFAELKSE